MPEDEQETIHVRGEGGTVFRLGLPLHEEIANRLESGHLKRVNPDGTPYSGPADNVPAPPTSAPKPAASKPDWVAWAVACGADPEDAAAATKQDLIDLYADAEPK